MTDVEKAAICLCGKYCELALKRADQVDKGLRIGTASEERKVAGAESAYAFLLAGSSL